MIDKNTNLINRTQQEGIHTHTPTHLSIYGAVAQKVNHQQDGVWILIFSSARQYFLDFRVFVMSEAPTMTV